VTKFACSGTASGAPQLLQAMDSRAIGVSLLCGNANQCKQMGK
jgi:hypothetical protein